MNVVRNRLIAETILSYYILIQNYTSLLHVILTFLSISTIRESLHVHEHSVNKWLPGSQHTLNDVQHERLQWVLNSTCWTSMQVSCH